MAKMFTTVKKKERENSVTLPRCSLLLRRTDKQRNTALKKQRNRDRQIIDRR